MRAQRMPKSLSFAPPRKMSPSEVGKPQYGTIDAGRLLLAVFTVWVGKKGLTMRRAPSSGVFLACRQDA